MKKEFNTISDNRKQINGFKKAKINSIIKKLINFGYKYDDTNEYIDEYGYMNMSAACIDCNDRNCGDCDIANRENSDFHKATNYSNKTYSIVITNVEMLKDKRVRALLLEYLI